MAKSTKPHRRVVRRSRYGPAPAEQTRRREWFYVHQAGVTAFLVAVLGLSLGGLGAIAGVLPIEAATVWLAVIFFVAGFLGAVLALDGMVRMYERSIARHGAKYWRTSAPARTRGESLPAPIGRGTQPANRFGGYRKTHVINYLRRIYFLQLGASELTEHSMLYITADLTPDAIAKQRFPKTLSGWDPDHVRWIMRDAAAEVAELYSEKEPSALEQVPVEPLEPNEDDLEPASKYSTNPAGWIEGATARTIVGLGPDPTSPGARRRY